MRSNGLVYSIEFQVYRCITSLKGKDGSSSGDSYPYLRLLLLFDAQQVGHSYSSQVSD